ncbi:MAG: peptidylprolyl isomerase [Sulfurimonas sp. RIFOXYC2_FULL_36_7]|uniref:peptidylprolyl isomerase n=1 Tax=Sulfurimonas sp. TaxID=2022749 RepID=UPI0008D74BEE|nr:peptidylprolyl isomerase [Sulfurimonas sp.]MDD3855792.1 peptidylprolyl isomerase [Sulfurimonas sp.]OHE08198.1 MAG: peptidylprolyl isomerase [Sulfurimonas sp. RIFOXYC2_FULL_36_7]
MITWMQRHKKYLIVSIWISTIAFVGAGFVGWGQYNYGDKAGAVAKVGNVEITMGELQKSYSNLYAQYNQMFQGNFDEEKAKSFGLQSQALKFLTQQALILNLAASYDLQVSDAELLADIKTRDYFFKDGVFNKDVYKEVLSKNNLSIKEYEASAKKDLLIQKTLALLPVQAKDSELKILGTAMNIADKIEYKVLKTNEINIDMSDELLKPFWEKIQNKFMTEVSYEVKFIKQAKISKEYDDATINEYYNENKADLKDSEGKILPIEAAKDKIKEELNAKETKKEALKAYIAYKKGELKDVEVSSSTISLSNNSFGAEALESVSKLTSASPFSKPVMVGGGDFITFELIKTNPSTPKSYEDAKGEVISVYVPEQKKAKLLELAKSSFNTFHGSSTDFITGNDSNKLTDLSIQEADEFLAALFTTQDKRGFVSLENGNVVIYNILEQKMLSNSNVNQDNPIVKLKSAMFNESLVKNLQNKYKTEIFIQGL